MWDIRLLLRKIVELMQEAVTLRTGKSPAQSDVDQCETLLCPQKILMKVSCSQMLMRLISKNCKCGPAAVFDANTSMEAFFVYFH